MSRIGIRAAHRVALASALWASTAGLPCVLVAQQEHAGHPRQAPPAADSAARAPAAGGRDESAMPSMIAPMASGTSWVPLSSPVHGAHAMSGQWMLMLHGVAYGQYMNQEGRRGGWQFGSINWLMLSYAHPTPGGRV